MDLTCFILTLIFAAKSKMKTDFNIEYFKKNAQVRKKHFKTQFCIMSLIFERQ